MKSFIRKIFEGESDENCRKHFVRFGRGDFNKRFLIGFDKSKKIKVKASYEFSNEFVNFVRMHKDNIKFSGKVLTTKKVEGLAGRKKAGSFAYEIFDSSLEKFENVYFYLLNASSDDIVLKTKKGLPKIGQGDKMDDRFCVMELDLKYWGKVKDAFFWDIPDSAKKVSIAHDIKIKDIVVPNGISDPVKLREMSKRKGSIVRRINLDGKEEVREKEFAI